MGLRRLRDLTKPVDPRPALSKGRSVNSYGSGFSGVFFSGILLLVFLVLAMPGLGDALGTAPRIEEAVKWLYSGFSDLLRGVR